MYTNTVTGFLLKINWHFLMKGIHIQPASDTEETRLNIENVEKSRSDQVKIIGSGMLWPKLFSFKDLTCKSKNSSLGNFTFSFVIII
jgi:hypothetical protein